MNNINYDLNRNEVTITGCIDCPFSFSTSRSDAHCELISDLNWHGELPDYFPTSCPLRDPNFTLRRIFNEYFRYATA